MVDLPKLSQFPLSAVLSPLVSMPSRQVSCTIFSAASEARFGSVSYLCLTNDQGDVHCSFLSAKSRTKLRRQSRFHAMSYQLQQPPSSKTRS